MASSSLNPINTLDGFDPSGHQNHSLRGWLRHSNLESVSPKDPKGKKYLFAIPGFVILVHLSLLLAYLNRDQSISSLRPSNKVEIEFIKPKTEEPPKVEPPKPTPPKVVHQAPPPPVVTHQVKTEVAEKDVPSNVPTIQENTTAPKATGPLIASKEPQNPQPSEVKQEVVTEPIGNAAYLNNPPPEYPAFAQRQGWEGSVLLRVHVLASGKPDKVEIKQSSGRKTLDESALDAVKGWTFVPSKRGTTPIEGWATVPIEFKLKK